jgi:proteasome activator subunit 4
MDSYLTPSFAPNAQIYNNAMFFWGVTKHDFDTRWKGFHVVKKSLENKLTKKKQHIRALMVDRLVLQHEVCERRH